MKQMTCCCHICKTSLNQYRNREFLPCNTCNKIVCRNCFGSKYKSQTWEEAVAMKDIWDCPSCQGNCPCPRCKAKPKATFPILTEEFKPHYKRQEKKIERLAQRVYQQQREESPYSDEAYTWEAQKAPPAEQLYLDDEPFELAKLAPKVTSIMMTHMEELTEREKRCEANIAEMERLLRIMLQEKADINDERQKLQSFLAEIKNY